MLRKTKYRYQNPGGTIGGPLIIPGTRFNKNREKLFFFFSFDKLYNATTINNTYTMPTALERAGDFSKTVTTTGVLIPVTDPSTQAPFPGNVIPTSRISPQGQAMLNLFPLPVRWGWRSTRPATAVITSVRSFRRTAPWTTRFSASTTTSRRS